MLGREDLKFIPCCATLACIPGLPSLSFQRSVTGAPCPAPRALLGIDANLEISVPKEDGDQGMREGEMLARGSALHSS